MTVTHLTLHSLRRPQELKVLMSVNVRMLVCPAGAWRRAALVGVGLTGQYGRLLGLVWRGVAWVRRPGVYHHIKHATYGAFQ